MGQQKQQFSLPKELGQQDNRTVLNFLVLIRFIRNETTRVEMITQPSGRKSGPGDTPDAIGQKQTTRRTTTLVHQIQYAPSPPELFCSRSNLFPDARTVLLGFSSVLAGIRTKHCLRILTCWLQILKLTRPKFGRMLHSRTTGVQIGFCLASRNAFRET